jgi:hypothetical protein
MFIFYNLGGGVKLSTGEGIFLKNINVKMEEY